MPFENEHAAVLGGEAAGERAAVAADNTLQRQPAQTGKFRFMRRENGHTAAAGFQKTGISGEGIDAVRVQHDALRGKIQQKRDQLFRPAAAPQTGTEREHIAAGQLIRHGAVARLTKHAALIGERKRHGGRALDRLDLPDTCRHAQIDQSAAGVHGGFGGKVRRAGIADCPADDQELAEGPLVTVLFAPGKHG